MIPHLQRLNVLLAELKRRQVFRAVAVYAVAAWAVTEVTATVLPLFFLPEWLVRVVVALMVMGFPLVLTFAWAFDLTLEGVQRTGEDGGHGPAATLFLRSPAFRATLVLLVSVLTLGAGWISWQVWLKPGAFAGEEPPAPRALSTAALDAGHVAVLYFDDFSSGGELGYVANGITEALIHELSQVELLTVVSRNGVKPYRDLEIPYDSMARRLNVGSIVEGSVAGTEERMEVTVSLIDGNTGHNLHSEKIQGSGTDILALRDQIVEEAVRQVGRSLGREIQEREMERPTGNPEAWEFFQRADDLLEDADTLRWALGDMEAAGRALARADSLLSLAARLDPAWPDPVLGRGWLARTRSGMLSASQTNRDPQILAQGLRAADEALRRAPESPRALELRGTLRVDLYMIADSTRTGELARAAEEDLRGAVARDPRRALAWVSLAQLLRTQGDFTEASLAAERALDADPFLINAEKEILFILAQIWVDLGDVGRAARWYDEGRRRYPAEAAFPIAKLVILAGVGGEGQVVDSARALRGMVEAAFSISDWNYGDLMVAAVMAQEGRDREARTLIRQVRERGGRDPWERYYEANARLWLGDEAEALDLLEEYLGERPHRKAYIAEDWYWERLRGNPRFQALVREGDR